MARSRSRSGLISDLSPAERKKVFVTRGLPRKTLIGKASSFADRYGFEVAAGAVVAAFAGVWLYYKKQTTGSVL